jgi:hypothetical protein
MTSMKQPRQGIDTHTTLVLDAHTPERFKFDTGSTDSAAAIAGKCT